MIKNVIKRDGRRRKFNPTKIVAAIKNAMVESKINIEDEELDTLFDEVVDKCGNKSTIKVEEIQDIVEKVLMSKFPDAAKAFIIYRNERNRVRNTKSEIVKTIKEITESSIKDSNILRDNANEAGATPAGAYGKIASETNKMYNLLNNMNRKYAEEHKNGKIHIHDLNFYNLSFNCLFAPVGKLLKNGFDSGTGFLRSPNSIQTAGALTAVILQLQSNQQFGGIADDNIDFDLAPFVDKSFKKNLNKELDAYYTYNDIQDNEEKNFDLVSMNEPIEKIASTLHLEDTLCIQRAIEQTDKDTHQSMEALIGNLNSLQSRSGNQVPFSSLNFGLDTSNCGRMVSHNLIKAQKEGLGDGLTAIFPILIFKLMKGYTKDENDPNYDLYNEAIECLSRRFYPNFVSVDSSFNKPYVKYNSKIITLEDNIFEGKSNNSYCKFKITENNMKDLLDKEYEVAVGDYWKISGISKIGDRVQLALEKLNEHTTIATMGCRTRVIGNINGTEQTTGRGNFAFHTINLPRIAIETHIETKDYKARHDLFFSKLDEILEDVKGSLLDRFHIIAKKTYENYPFTMQQGLYLTSDDEKHKLSDSIEKVLKQSTLSIGYVGLYETLLLLTGKTYGKDPELNEYGIEIVKHIRDFTDKCQKETNLNWSTFATPAEACAGRLCNIDKNLYRNNNELADVDMFQLFDKNFYTNSNMLPVDLETTLDNKIKCEAPFHKLANAGDIFYYKLNGDLSKNYKAVKQAIDAMYDGDLGYFTVSFDSDTCLNCGYHGIIDNECPKCGSEDENKILRVRRITGYLTGSPSKRLENSWNDSKLSELKIRKNQ